MGEVKEGQFYKNKTKEPHIYASTEKKKKSTSCPHLLDDRIYLVLSSNLTSYSYYSRLRICEKLKFQATF